MVAVEPSPGLRSALLARVHGDEDLRTRVTVLPSSFPDVELPERFSALIAMNVLGHFDTAQRACCGRCWPNASTAEVSPW